MIDVFIVGSKGLPARYGGFETFVDNLTKNKTDSSISYFVSCMRTPGVEKVNNAVCFGIPAKPDRPVFRLLQVAKSIKWCIRYSRGNLTNDKKILYILGCRVGPFLIWLKKKLHKNGFIIACNPDGLEWKRGKWNKIEKKILKFCEKSLILNSDYIVCDSIGIQDYVHSEYPVVPLERTTYIAYGDDIVPSKTDNQKFLQWKQNVGLAANGDYYLVVGRFVPENNFALMIKEFMASSSKKKLVLITNLAKNKFYKKLLKECNFESDPRVIFAGTVYDQELLKKIRENAFAYLHGHSVGGTNPSLLEAMGHTKINILFDVPFNREVGRDQALYFSSETGSLRGLINFLDSAVNVPSFDSKKIIQNSFSWSSIVEKYESFFTLA